MRRRMTALWIGIVLLFASGCGSSEGTVAEPAAATASGDTTESGEPTYVFPSGPEEGEISICSSSGYSTINELCDDAEYIIIGRVFLREFQWIDGICESIVQVWVDEVLSGDMPADRMITVSEMGGQSSDGHTASVCYVPLLQEGERVLLFLKGPWEYPDPWKTGYFLVGDYQGKFFYKQEEDCWYVAGLLGKNASVPSDATKPIPDEEMRQLLDRFQKSIDGEAP